MFNRCEIIALWGTLMLSCNIVGAYACAPETIDNTRFASATSFVAGEENYRLSDLVMVADTAQTYAVEWTKNKALKVVPAGKAVEDRYGRCAVYLFDDVNNYSLQYALVKEGLAVGYNEKSGRYVRALIDAEQQARSAQKGLWEKSDVVIGVDDTPNHIGSFAIIEGTVKSIYNHKKEHVMLNFGDDWKTDFTVFLPNFSAKKFEKGYLNSLKGKKIEVRGVLYEKNGPSISILNKNYLIKHLK